MDHGRPAADGARGVGNYRAVADADGDQEEWRLYGLFVQLPVGQCYGAADSPVVGTICMDASQPSDNGQHREPAHLQSYHHYG